MTSMTYMAEDKGRGEGNIWPLPCMNKVAEYYGTIRYVYEK